MSPRQPRPVVDLALARQLAALPQGLTITCAGRSMEPTVRPGEQVLVRAVRWGAGDVVLFETGGGELELHRVLARLPGGIVVHRGDNPVGRAGVVRAARVIGRAALPWRPVRGQARAIAAALGRSLRSRLRPPPAAPR